MNIAILIASENYADPDEKLTSPGKDIELLENSLKEYCKYDKYIPLLIEDGKPHAGAEQQIKDIFNGLAGEDIENILFYFSGHGRYDEDENDSLLLLNDVETLAITKIAGWIINLSPQNTCIIIDACEAGDDTIIEYDGFTDDNSLGFFGIFASTPTTYAIAYPDISLFTYAFCNALDDYSNYTNNEVSINKIYEYIYQIFRANGISQRISMQIAQKDVPAFAFWRKPVPHSKAPNVSLDYIERSDETLLIDTLLRDKTLLLCGDTKVGKTHLSLSLAKKIWKQGYEFLRTNELDAARNFLSYSDHPRICLLDDPYGSWKTLTDSNRHKIVSDIIENKPVSNLLIITSRKDIVLEINACSDLAKCSENAISWQEIHSEKGVLLKGWSIYAHRIGFNDETIEKYAEYLSSSENALTIGNLNTIVTEIPKEDIEHKSLLDIVHLSQIDAKEQAGIYLNAKPEIWNICTILALTCNTIDSVTLEDIRFILNNQPEYPSIEARNEVNFKTSTLDYTPSIPQYENLVVLDTQTNSHILWLEQHKVIEIKDEEIRFTHPYHQEVCIYILNKVSNRSINTLINYLYNSTYCLNPDAAYICSKNIRYIDLSTDELCHAVIDIPMAYLHQPKYPKVRDSIMQYLMDDKINLSAEEAEELADLIAAAASLYIYWNGDIPYYDDYSHEHMLIRQDKLTPDEYAEGIELINRNAYLSSNLINRLLLHHGVDFKQNLFEKAVQAEEGFLRTAAIEYLFDYIDVIDNERFLELLSNNEHFLLPDSVFRTIELCFNHYPKVNDRLKAGLKAFISRILLHKNNCLRCSRLMLHFTIDYGSVNINWRDFSEEEQLELWNIWKDVFPIFLSNMGPKQASYLMTGRYSQTLMDFMKKASPDEYITLFESILQFCKLQIEADAFYHADQLVPISLAIRTTLNLPETRKDIISNIFSLHNADLTYHLLSVCTTNWNYLRDDEKEIVKQLLEADNSAAALALFCPDCPIEILHFITKNASLGFDNIQAILSNLSADLLNCCIDIFTEKRILAEYYYNCYKENAFASQCLLYLFANENERIYEISSALLSHNLMTYKLWCEVTHSTQHINELAQSLSDLFDLGYAIKDYDKYWFVLFCKFVGDCQQDEFAKYFFYAYIRLRTKFPDTDKKSLERHFSQPVIDYYNSMDYQDLFKSILEEVKAGNSAKF